jgi:hypothetical protein
LGRGGGATSGTPCGWEVFYAYENVTPGYTATPSATTSTVAIFTGTAITMNMWTDNSIIKAASAFALTAFAGLLF